jgi:hypothetical protein
MAPTIEKVIYNSYPWFKKPASRSDDFFDHDTNMCHFFGATPINGSKGARPDDLVSRTLQEQFRLLKNPRVPTRRRLYA